ncbi:MAG: enoyl-CoA hydratase [Chloroflexota bacterium]|nr:enoyl-CoA hydratase [Chloroflexota bacterium]
MSIKESVAGRVAEVVLDFPPVNALPVQAWFDLAEILLKHGRDPGVSVVILAAEGKGFCAGPDMKEFAAGGRDAVIHVSRGCYAAFAAVFECEVPVIAAVQGFCVGGGIGLVGNADIIVASDDAVFGLPEVDRGALGAATHLSRLVPGKRMRAMFYTGENASAQELKSYGSILEVVTRDDLRDCARRVAARIASKHPTVIRRAKESVNGIEAVDPRASYRFEQGFTFELNLSDVPDEARKAYVEKRKPEFEPQDG